MLSRSAERLYWLARYMERTENMAKLVSVYMNLLMDLPRGVEMGWQQLLRINGSEAEFYEKYKVANERNVTRFMLTDASYSSSLFSSLTSARENIRTTRELLPDEAWEQVNEMYLFTKNDPEAVSNRRSRVLFLKKIIEGCQRFSGLLSGYMSHNHPYRFIRLGRNLERADMTSRILDLASLLLAESRSDELRQYETILWINILTALNALLMYRQHMRSRVKGDDVLSYLLLDKNLPRSVARCLLEVSDCINELPNNDALPDRVVELEDYVQDIDTHQATQLQLRAILDDLQNKLGGLHGHIADNWFSRIAAE
ncbi:MAG: alpha-E domain-containing protein [Methylovulum sp.]|uniref:alpha-E domain-containing protein n=1 Tax=Methylovulum sp. TaxID=1916980 RepID=UPI0026258F0D|nr:alpha-E domain-containing protein [Methylovulum sp.]MDD2723631.1 alpha-E domain-containing protein [Methylovulum sp.]MDD5124304.1 alpha-E domain-containing protein [Methylovulum sp.]